MSDVTLETTVGQLVAERPERSRIFEKLGIDYCCGGKKSLEQACREKNLDPATVRLFFDFDDVQAGGAEENWSKASLSDLADHIQQAHHAYLKRELPRLRPMVSKVAHVHGANFPWLLELEKVFGQFADDMELHTEKEDTVVFPVIRGLEKGQLPAAEHCGGTVAQPVRAMEHEHDAAGRLLERMRELAGGYVTPPEGCNTFRAMMSGLAELEADTHRHVHKENSILFPRAIEAEARLRG